MKTRKCATALALILLGGCMGPEATSQLNMEEQAVKDRISQAREERKSYGKGSVVYDLISLRLAIHEQTLAMLDQRRAAGSWRTRLSYTVNGKPWTAPGDVEAKISSVEAKLKSARAGRESDLQLVKGADEAVKPLYVMSAATKSILISQLEYQLAAHRFGFPPYYVPFHPPAEGTTPPQIITVPEGKSAIVQ